MCAHFAIEMYVMPVRMAPARMCGNISDLHLREARWPAASVTRLLNFFLVLCAQICEGLSSVLSCCSSITFQRLDPQINHHVSQSRAVQSQ